MSSIEHGRRVLSRLARVPHLGWIGLAVIVLGAVAVRISQAHGFASPQIYCDEFIYAGTARSIAREGSLALRGQAEHSNALYPALISPAWLAHSIGTAYTAAKAINACLMALGAVPVYLWARRSVAPGWSLLAAGLAVLIPGFVFTGMIMSENVFFPAFLLALLGFALVLERPTLARQAFALVAVGVACAARTQGLILLAILATAILLKLLFDLRSGDQGGPALARVRAFWPSSVVLAAGVILYLASTSGSFASRLGSYEAVAQGTYSLGGTTRWAIRHLAELVLSVGVIPACALVVLAGLAIGGALRGPGERSLVALALSSVIWIAIEAGAFAEGFSRFVVERYTFYVAPVLILAFVIWLARGAPRPPRATTIAAVLPAALLLALPLQTFVIRSGAFNILTLRALFRWSERLPGGFDDFRVFYAAGVALACLLFAAVPRRAAGVLLPVVVGAFLIAASRPVLTSLQAESQPPRSLAGPDASWVEHRLGRNTPVAYLFSSPAQSVFESSQLMLQTEFWNRGIDRVINLGTSETCPLPEQSATLATATGRIDTRGKSSPRYLVVDQTTEVVGRPLASGGAAGFPLELYEVKQPLRLAKRVDGVYGDGWAGAATSYTQYGTESGRPGELQVVVSRVAWGGPDVPSHVVINVGTLRVNRKGAATIGVRTERRTWILHSLAQRVFRIPTPRPPFRAEVHIDPTFSPVNYGFPDSRQLGAQVSFAFKPPQAPS